MDHTIMLNQWQRQIKVDYYHISNKAFDRIDTLGKLFHFDSELRTGSESEVVSLSFELSFKERKNATWTYTELAKKEKKPYR